MAVYSTVALQMYLHSTTHYQRPILPIHLGVDRNMLAGHLDVRGSKK